MTTLDKAELANQIRREMEFRGWEFPGGISGDEFETTLVTFHRRYLEQLFVALGLQG